MKKILCIIFCFILLLSMTGCNHHIFFRFNIVDIRFYAEGIERVIFDTEPQNDFIFAIVFLINLYNIPVGARFTNRPLIDIQILFNY